MLPSRFQQPSPPNRVQRRRSDWTERESGRGITYEKPSSSSSKEYPAISKDDAPSIHSCFAISCLYAVKTVKQS
uniref:Uncharacterized protein n=1 Tax=Rhizophora mucronata TaxID=61149 RepID=A0A2P2LZ75_RHIMU